MQIVEYVWHSFIINVAIEVEEDGGVVQIVGYVWLSCFVNIAIEERRLPEEQGGWR